MVLWGSSWIFLMVVAMNKILLIVIAFLLIIIIWIQWSSNHKSNEIKELQNKLTVAVQNEDMYKKKLEREHNDRVELEKRQEENKEIAKSDESFNWDASIANSPLIIKLREDSIRIQRDRARAD